MPGILWRILLAVVCVVLTFALLPPVCRVIGLDLTSDILLIVKLCVAGIAVFYILRGPVPPWSRG